ncbi:MAG: hypothetical protein ACE5IY_05575 [bacterium]
MDDKSVFELAKDPRFTPGIYNFCDRWCERCQLSQRCLVYAMEKEEMDQLASYEIVDEAYWRKLLGTLDKIMAKLRRDFKKAGLDFADARVRNKAADAVKERNQNHPLSRAAFDYSRIVKRWMSRAKRHFEPKIDELYQRLDLGLDEEAITNDSDSIVDAIDVIIWYQHEIRAKLLRALAQLELEIEDTQTAGQKNSDGSAKVALIGIDNSIQAWSVLRIQLPDKADEILTFLARLERLRKDTENRFPEARLFRRPGFDD